MAWVVTSQEYAGVVLIVELRDGERVVEILADLAIEGRVVTLSGFHAVGSGTNRIGAATLLALARWTVEVMDLDELRIEGATRTSGANPGHDPRPLVFRRTRGGAAAS